MCIIGLVLAAMALGLGALFLLAKAQKENLGKLYYINDRYAHLHFDFCRQFLNEYDDLALFNDNNYEQRAGRKYYLGNLNYIHSTEKFMLEFSVADDISVAQIKKANRLKSDNLQIGQKLLIP